MATTADDQSPPALGAFNHASQTVVPRWQRIGRMASTALIFAALGAIALCGSLNDWTIPKFSLLLGNSGRTNNDWCAAHNVPESDCIECNASLLAAEKSFGWCKEHGVVDCPLEHPEIAQLPEVPVVTEADRQRASRALGLRPRGTNNSHCESHRRHIQFASAEALDKAGVDIAVAEQQPVTEMIRANGEVVYDPTRMAHLSSRAAGTIWRVEKQIGDSVERGDVLALVDASEVGRLKTGLLQAITQVRLRQTNVNRLRPLLANGSITEKSIREAETALEEAQVSLLSAQQALVNLGLQVRAEDLNGLTAQQMADKIQFLGVPAELVSKLEPATTTSNLLPIVASLPGMVVAQDAVAGEVIDPKSILFSVADTTRLWLMLNVRQEDVSYVRPGQIVLFESSDASPSANEIRGSVAWISSAADDRTRTVQVRVNLRNDDGQLRANTFGEGCIVLREEPAAIVVPNEAIHWDGDCSVVFVRDKNWFRADAPKFFRVRKVRLGVQQNDRTEVIAGLLPGEVLAGRNSTLLEAQLLKSNLGEGCGCAH